MFRFIAGIFHSTLMRAMNEFESICTVQYMCCAGRMCVYNLFYEFFTVCTSVIARNDAGQLYHARNLDFGLFLGFASPTPSCPALSCPPDCPAHLQFFA